MTHTHFALALAALTALPLAAMAQTPAPETPSVEPQEAALPTAARIGLAQAGDLAIKAHGGTLSGIVFGDTDGKGVYEAEVLDGSGQFWTLKIDAMTGEVLAQGQAHQMEEHPDTGSDGESNVDGANDG